MNSRNVGVNLLGRAAAGASVGVALGAQTAALRRQSTALVHRLLAATVAALVLQLGSSSAAVETGTAPLPELLSQTGLYVAGSITDVSADVLSFTPQYPLWTDGATKRRWIWLPPDSFIDARNANAWDFPIGTRLWKEFAMGRPIETRMIERVADGSWRFATYVWRDDGSDAVLAPTDGIPALAVATAPNGRYSIPSEYDCRACHEGAAAPAIGFSALQLWPDRDPLALHGRASAPDDLDLRTLAARGLIRNLSPSLLDRPPRIAAASPEERAALGYLHGNCGHCHSDPELAGAAVPVGILLAQDVTDPESTTRILRSLVNVTSRFRGPGTTDPATVVVPGHADQSVLVTRMRSRDPRAQMPPLGTAIPDRDSLELVERWINQSLVSSQ